MDSTLQPVPNEVTEVSCVAYSRNLLKTSENILVLRGGLCCVSLTLTRSLTLAVFLTLPVSVSIYLAVSVSLPAPVARVTAAFITADYFEAAKQSAATLNSSNVTTANNATDPY